MPPNRLRYLDERWTRRDIDLPNALELKFRESDRNLPRYLAFPETQKTYPSTFLTIKRERIKLQQFYDVRWKAENLSFKMHIAFVLVAHHKWLLTRIFHFFTICHWVAMVEPPYHYRVKLISPDVSYRPPERAATQIL